MFWRNKKTGKSAKAKTTKGSKPGQPGAEVRGRDPDPIAPALEGRKRYTQKDLLHLGGIEGIASAVRTLIVADRERKRKYLPAGEVDDD